MNVSIFWTLDFINKALVAIKIVLSLNPPMAHFSAGHTQLGVGFVLSTESGFDIGRQPRRRLHGGLGSGVAKCVAIVACAALISGGCRPQRTRAMTQSVSSVVACVFVAAQVCLVTIRVFG